MAKDWAKFGDDIPVKELVNSSIACYKNACDLLFDAEILYKNDRCSSSIVFSILSEEEFSKSFMLHSCSLQPRWDSAIWKALINHGDKQALSEGMRQLMDLVQKQIKNNDFISRMNKISLVPCFGHNFLTEKAVGEVIAPLKKSHVKSKEIDKYKQSKLYVSIGKDGDVTGTPSSEKTEAAKYISLTKEFKCIVEKAYSETEIVL